ncbi:MAG: HD domain-containing protein [Planctomycetes bacterium]|nr:HD domain-containing protein [Planctomycetota bacterium]
MPRLKLLNGPSKGHVVEIAKNRMVFGRDESCDYQVLDRGASRRHAEIFRMGRMVFVRDLGSRNGVLVNDDKVDEQLLLHDDRILVGNTLFLFEDDLPDVQPGEQADIPFDEELDKVAANSEPPLDTTSVLELRLDDISDVEGSHGSRESANFRAIYRLGGIVTSGKDETSLLNEVFDFIQGILPADNVYIFMRDDASGKLVPKLYREKVRGAGVSRSIIRRSIREARSILTSDASRDVRFRAEESVILNRVRSVVCIPLTVQERVNGVFYLASLRPDQPFREDDLQFLTVAGSLIGTALHGIEMSRKQRETFLNAIRSVISISEMRDPETEGHSGRVSRFAAAVGRQFPLNEREVSRLRLAALLHDVGKAAVPQSVLDSKGVGNADHTDEHALLGEKLASGIAGGEELAPAIRHHHERWDGKGFPDGLAGEDIPLVSRIIAAADGVDHVVQDSLTPQSVIEAGKWLKEHSGESLDPAVADVSAQVLEESLKRRNSETAKDDT